MLEAFLILNLPNNMTHISQIQRHILPLHPLLPLTLLPKTNSIPPLLLTHQINHPPIIHQPILKFLLQPFLRLELLQSAKLILFYPIFHDFLDYSGGLNTYLFVEDFDEWVVLFSHLIVIFIVSIQPINILNIKQRLYYLRFCCVFEFSQPVWLVCGVGVEESDCRVLHALGGGGFCGGCGVVGG